MTPFELSTAIPDGLKKLSRRRPRDPELTGGRRLADLAFGAAVDDPESPGLEEVAGGVELEDSAAREIGDVDVAVRLVDGDPRLHHKRPARRTRIRKAVGVVVAVSDSGRRAGHREQCRDGEQERECEAARPHRPFPPIPCSMRRWCSRDLSRATRTGNSSEAASPRAERARESRDRSRCTADRGRQGAPAARHSGRRAPGKGDDSPFGVSLASDPQDRFTVLSPLVPDPPEDPGPTIPVPFVPAGTGETGSHRCPPFPQAGGASLTYLYTFYKQVFLIDGDGS